MDNIKDILGKYRFLDTLKESLAIEKILQESWGDLFGDLSKDIYFNFFKKGIVYAESTNPLWVKEIDFFKPMLLQKMNDLLKRKKIKDIRVYATASKKIPETEEVFSPKNLKEAIVWANQCKKTKGYTLCTTCQHVLTLKHPCVFCLNSKPFC